MKPSLAVIAALIVAGCGGNTGTGPGPTSHGTMSATVDGSSWSPPGTQIQASYGNNILAVAGTVNGTVTRQINLTVAGVAGVGTYDLGPANVSGLALLTLTSGTSSISTWTTALSPATGSLTVTALDGTGAAGTFLFTGQAAPGTAATGQLSVTSGSFNVTF